MDFAGILAGHRFIVLGACGLHGLHIDCAHGLNWQSMRHFCQNSFARKWKHHFVPLESATFFVECHERTFALFSSENSHVRPDNVDSIAQLCLRMQTAIYPPEPEQNTSFVFHLTANKRFCVCRSLSPPFMVHRHHRITLLSTTPRIPTIRAMHNDTTRLQLW